MGSAPGLKPQTPCRAFRMALIFANSGAKGLMDTPIRIYSTPTCPFCQRAKLFLKERGVAFEEFDVASDRARAAEMMRISGQRGVPVIVVGSEVVVGFDQARLEALFPRPPPAA